MSKVKKANPINTSRCTCGSRDFAWVSSKLKICRQCEAEYRNAGK